MFYVKRFSLYWAYECQNDVLGIECGSIIDFEQHISEFTLINDADASYERAMDTVLVANGEVTAVVGWQQRIIRDECRATRIE